MAKRKKNKKQTAPQIPAPELAVKKGDKGVPAQGDGIAISSTMPPTSKSPKDGSGAGREKEIKTVRFSTCVAGMFLTLVLGVYLGTLFPGFFETQQAGRQAQTPAPGTVSNAAPANAVETSLMRSIAEAEKKAAAHLDSAPDWIHLGNLYFDAQMPDKAIQAYEHSLSLAPENADVLTDLGIMYREVGQFEKAVECFRKAITIEPGHQNAMFNEGVVLSTDLHKNEEAIAAWERLLEFNPNARAFDGRPITDMIKQLR